MTGVVPAKGNDAVGQMEASNYGQKRENCHGDFPAVRYSWNRRANDRCCDQCPLAETLMGNDIGMSALSVDDRTELYARRYRNGSTQGLGGMHCTPGRHCADVVVVRVHLRSGRNRCWLADGGN